MWYPIWFFFFRIFVCVSIVLNSLQSLLKGKHSIEYPGSLQPLIVLKSLHYLLKGKHSILCPGYLKPLVVLKSLNSLLKGKQSIVCPGSSQWLIVLKGPHARQCVLRISFVCVCLLAAHHLAAGKKWCLALLNEKPGLNSKYSQILTSEGVKWHFCVYMNPGNLSQAFNRSECVYTFIDSVTWERP